MFLKSCLFLLAISPVCSVALGQDNDAALALEKLLGTPYSAFASHADTAGGQGVSCVSAVQYALTVLGHACSSPDLKVFYQGLKKQAEVLRPGKTPLSGEGTVLFNALHFAVVYQDSNLNGVVDHEDIIAHARFEPLRLDPLSKWLNADPVRPVYAVPVSGDFVCP